MLTPIVKPHIVELPRSAQDVWSEAAKVEKCSCLEGGALACSALYWVATA